MKPQVRMFLGGFGAAAAAFNAYESGVAGYHSGMFIWIMVYVAWVCIFAWGFRGWLLGKLKKN